MTLADDKYYLKMAWLWVAGFSLFRLFYASLFPLVPDETNYWQWSRYFAWGYHDQAPMIAWAIKLTTRLLGHNELGVRLPSVIAMTVASAYLVLIANRWIGPYTAFKAAVLSQAILEFNVGGLLATPDGLQAAAWAGACYHVADAYENDRWSQWIMGGLWFGFGLLSKYTMVIFLPGAYLFGLFCPPYRKRLAGLRPYVGVLLGSLLFLPVILWNAQNDWNSVRHVAYLGGANQQFAIHWKYFGDFMASQAGLLSPLVFLLVLWAWSLVLLKKYRSESWIYYYLFFTSFPMFALFGFLSLHTRVYGNWPGAGYLTAAVMVAAFFTGQEKEIFRSGKPSSSHKLWSWTVGSAYVITALVLIQVVWPILPIPPKLDRTATELSGWRELGIKAEQLRRQMPMPDRTFLFGLRYQTASELAFYTPGQPRTVSINKWKRPNVYDYWWKDEDLIGRDAVGLTEEPDSHVTRLNQVFEKVDPPIEFKIYPRRIFSRGSGTQTPVKILYFYRAYGFKGGLRWVPPDQNDIRAS
ncbi:MAG: glycosyltransferase family 39 protein [Thermodesulfobacteriota bacterium]